MIKRIFFIDQQWNIHAIPAIKCIGVSEYTQME